MKTDKIKNKTNPDTFFKPQIDCNINEKKVSFSFEYFKGESTKNTRIGYNGYYFDIKSSRNAIGDFFRTVIELSKLTIGEIKNMMKKKNVFHLGQIDREEHISRIETLLKDNYGFPHDKIEEFDKEYYEFQISDGKRIIWHMVDNSIYPLFVDNNHMVCIESSRDLKAKMKYNVKSSFTHLSEDEFSKKDLELEKNIQYLIDEYDNGDKLSADDIIELLKEIISH